MRCVDERRHIGTLMVNKMWKTGNSNAEIDSQTEYFDRCLILHITVRKHK